MPSVASPRSFHSAWINRDGVRRTDDAATLMFPWWSFTKTVLAVAALRLVELGRLELDAPRSDKPYTLRHLLQHRAGVPNYGSLATYHEAVARGDAAWPREKLLEAVGGERLLFPPGASWTYSNVGYMFVGDAIKEATGLPLAAALQELVLAPLDMPTVRLATEPDDFAGVFWPALRRYDPRWVYHGCLIGTPADAARMLHAVMIGHCLGPETFRTMLERHELGGALPDRPWTRCGYSLGLMTGRMDGAGCAISHSGGGPHSSNAVYHFPDFAVPLTVASFSNTDDEGPVEFEAVRIAVATQT